MAWPAKCKVCTTRQAKPHTHTTSLSLVIQYTGRNVHTGDQTFKKSVVLDNLSLKYRRIFKNGQQKKISAKRPLKNGQKKPNGQPKNRTANQLEIRQNFQNFAAKQPIWQP